MHTFCLRLTRELPAASFMKRRSCRVKSLLLTWKMLVPLMSDTLKSFSPRVHSFEETTSSTGYCARYCGPITTTGCSTGWYVLIAGMGLLGACPVAIITKLEINREKWLDFYIIQVLIVITEVVLERNGV